MRKRGKKRERDKIIRLSFFTKYQNESEEEELEKSRHFLCRNMFLVDVENMDHTIK